MKNQTTNELGQARKYYRGGRLPKTALSVMDAVTERLATEKVGTLALLFILVNAADIGQTANQMLKHLNNPKDLRIGKLQ